MSINAKNICDDEFFFGHKACAGCGATLALRHALKVLGPNTTVALPAGCMSAVGFNFPQLCFANNAMITPFAATAAVASGISAGLKMQEIDTSTHPVIGFAGDGGTADIGLQALSGAIDRNDDIIYFCYDNEAYMNTGIQKSGLTPRYATTTTTPGVTSNDGSHGSHEREAIPNHGSHCSSSQNTEGSNNGSHDSHKTDHGSHKCFSHGNRGKKKNIFEIVAAHNIAYAATASVGYLPDYIKKIEKAQSIRGTKFIHVIAPCPTGWGHAESDTVQIAKQIVDCGLWYLAEFEGEDVSDVPGGKFSITKKPKEFSSVENYLKCQKRFAKMTEADVDAVICARNAKWEQILRDWVTN